MRLRTGRYGLLGCSLWPLCPLSHRLFMSGLIRAEETKIWDSVNRPKKKEEKEEEEEGGR